MLQFLLTISDEKYHPKIEYLYNTFHHKMIAYAEMKFYSYGRKNVKEDAEDAVQSTFLNMVKYINSIDFSRSEQELGNYCFAILTNEIYKTLKRNNENLKYIKDFSVKEEYSLIDEIDLRERYTEAVKAIEELDERYSSTLYFIFCKEMTVNELAKMMGISTKTVYTRLARGKELLRDSLKGAKFNG